MKLIHTFGKILLAFCLLVPSISIAQKVGIDKEFSFDENSKTESFTFKVEEGTKKLIIDFEGLISKGGLKVKITDPDGNQISGFSLLTSKSVSVSSSYSDERSKKQASSSASAQTSPDAEASSKAAYSSSSSSSSSSRSRSTTRARSSSRSVSVEVDDSSVVDVETNSNTHIYTNEKTDTNESGARGVINKEITNPTKGIWKFTIYPDDTSGYLSAKILYK